MPGPLSVIGRTVALLVLVAVIAGAVWAFLHWRGEREPQRPDIAFAPLEDTSLSDPDNPIKVFRVDLARVEHEFPLSRADLMKLTPESLATLSQEEVDQIYGRLTAGPIPHGPYRGTLFFARGDSLRQRLDEVLGGIGGRIAGEKLDLMERVGHVMWKGKVFDRHEGVLRNFIEDLAPLAPLIDERDTIATARVPRGGLLGYIVPTTKVWLLFPAKVYCGQSLIDARRESIIVDYLFSEDIEGYRASPDSLAGRGGLRIRDEIRMVRPGFYLGRAYANRAFLLNFTLYNPEIADEEGPAFETGAPVVEQCWTGEQARQAAAQ